MTQQYPKHIAIIPDGNRTWATSQGKPAKYGHYQAYKLTLKLIDFVFDKTPIQAFTFWGLSTENLKKRSKEELDYLYDFALHLKKDLKKMMHAHQINFKWVGNPLGLPAKVLKQFDELQTLYSFPGDKTLIFAINYGGRDEIIRWIKTWAEQDGNVENLTEEHFSNFLDFKDIPPVDLVIRTKTELASRISGFMLRWIGYAELFFSKLHFPDLSPTELAKALDRFHERSTERNFWK